MIYTDYIEATGEQYIDTGVSISSGSMVAEMVFELTAIDDIQRDLLGYWATQGQQTGMIMFGVINRQFCTLQYNWGFMWNWAMTPTVNTRYTATVSVNSNTQSVTINGASYSASGVPLFDSETVELFRNDRQWYAKARLYSCKIWDGSTLVRDFVPAVDNGTPGLYDRVTDAFYTNSGTSEFLYPKWIMTDDGLVNPDMPPIAETCIAEPYPAQYWRTERGTLTHALLPGYSYEEGAFKYAELLTRISIPDGVESIGAESFRYSGLKKVSLPENCSYSTDSFPENCEVTVRGDYGQLTGPDGREVLDCYGRRLYVRRRSNNG